MDYLDYEDEPDEIDIDEGDQLDNALGDEFDEVSSAVFADPTGHSALRAASASNPRNLPCPQCHRPNLVTPADAARSYCCDTCADINEGMGC